MKSRIVFCLAALAVALAFALAGCVLAPITIEARLTRFIDALNTPDRTNAYLNFSSTETEYYDAIKAGLYWSGPFPVGAEGQLPYSIVTIDQSDPAAVLVTIQGPPNFGGTTNFQFVMVNESTEIVNWMIHELWIWDSVTSQYVVLIK